MRQNWTEAELALTLYVYLNYPKESLNKSSDFLLDFRNRLEKYTGIRRSINSIDLRIANYKYVDPNYHGKGLSGGGKEVVRIWNYYQNHMDELKPQFDEFLENTNEYTLEEALEEINKIEKVSFDEIKIFTQDAYIKSLVNQRNGKLQKFFKDNLLYEFECSCPLCGINEKQLLIASHIVPYSKCEKTNDLVNHNNGLLLCSNHDSLFDKGLITFRETGEIKISKIIKTDLYELLHISESYCLDKKYLTKERINYLKIHNKNYFFDNKKNINK